MCHNKILRFSLCFIFSLSLFSLYSCFSLWGVCFAAENINTKAAGSMELTIKADFEMQEDIHISITNEKFETEIYMIKAESKNDWRVADNIPAGKYIVNYVTIGDGKNQYSVHYPKNVSFKNGSKTDFEVIILNKDRLGASGRRGFAEIIKDNTINLILIAAGLVILLILKRKEDKKYE